MHTLDSMTLSVHQSTDFDHEDTVARQRLIGDGTTDEYVETLQGGALGNRVADIGCRVYDFDDVESLKALRASCEVVDYVDRRGYTHSVVVAELRITEFTFLWEVSIKLLEVSAPVLPGS